MRRTLIGAAGAAVGATAVLAGHALTVAAEPASAPHSTPAGATAGPSPTPRRLVDGTATGPIVQTDYGPVQVRITVVNGVLTDVAALILPTEHEHSQWIDANLVPQLRQRVLTAQSEEVDVMSGATFTSGGYLDSLQAALDQLGASRVSVGRSACADGCTPS